METSLSDDPKMVRFDYVVFTDISESYATDMPLKCTFSIRPSLKPTSSDNVGLYKVGWTSVNDCICSSNIGIKDGAEVGTDVTISVTFAETQLPKDDGEFYHFCYVISSGQVRGVSTPFQFITDDFEVIDDKIESYIDVENLIGEKLKSIGEIDMVAQINPTQKSSEVSVEKYIAEHVELEETLKKTTDELTICQMERDELKEKLKAVELNLVEMASRSKQDVESLTNNLYLKEQEIDGLKQELANQRDSLDRLNNEVHTADNRSSQLEGSLFALNMANEHLKERLVKTEKNYLDLSKRLQVADENAGQKWLMDLYEVKPPPSAAELNDNNPLTATEILKQPEVDENKDEPIKEMNPAVTDQVNALLPDQDRTPPYDKDHAELNQLEHGYYSYEAYPNTLYPHATWFPNPYIDYVPHYQGMTAAAYN